MRAHLPHPDRLLRPYTTVPVAKYLLCRLRHAVVLQRRKMIGAEAVAAIGGDHIAEPGAPEGHRVDQRLAQNNLG